MNCFARLARAVLGTTAVAVDKLCYGNPLEILGVSVTLTPRGVDLRVADKKRLLWAGQMRECLALKVMSPGDASRLAGRLSFACTCCFKRLGRSMVRPFFAQQYSPLPGHAMSHLLQMAAEWWHQGPIRRDGTDRTVGRRRKHCAAVLRCARSACAARGRSLLRWHHLLRQLGAVAAARGYTEQA